MKLIKLPANAGYVLYVNPDHVAGVLPHPDPSRLNTCIVNLSSGAAVEVKDSLKSVHDTLTQSVSLDP